MNTPDWPITASTPIHCFHLVSDAAESLGITNLQSVVKCDRTHSLNFSLAEFTSEEKCGQLAFLASNTVPLSAFLGSRWRELLGFVSHWTRRYSVINVVLGPVFDYDADSFADDPSTIK